MAGEAVGKDWILLSRLSPSRVLVVVIITVLIFLNSID